jgi:AP-3 complex subunit sigma
LGQSVSERQRIVNEIYSLISRRTDYVCNFLESSGTSLEKDTKVVYRHYATLYFIFWVDGSESELGILDLIQVLVETLDRSFENVCELDLIFNSDKVHYIIDEMVMGGMVLETSMSEICRTVGEMNKLEQAKK